MLNWLKRKLSSIFKSPSIPASNNAYNWEKTKGMSQSQLDKRTKYEPGQSYQVGQARATVHTDVYSMLKALAMYEHIRITKGIRLRERGIDLMMMSPEELQALQIDEWLESRKVRQGLLGMWDKLLKFNFLTKGRFEAPPQLKQAENTTKERIEEKEAVLVGNEREKV